MADRLRGQDSLVQIDCRFYPRRVQMNGLFKGLADVSYIVTDWQRSKKFYAETLELPVAAFLTDEVGWMEFGEKDNTHLAIMLARTPEQVQTGRGAIAVFSVDDAYKAVEELRRRGVKCEDVIAVPNMVTYATFYDPDGNQLQVAGPPPKG
jgi:predicted enzyme related to lactoylglutathione lyase